MRSIEGYRGMPTMRPPYPSEHGLWGHPTNINNVETYASVPSILLNGPDWFAGLGTARSGGTKAFALAGAIAELRPGRDPHRHDAARDDLRDRRRLSRRPGVQGRAVGRSVGRLHSRPSCWTRASTTRTSRPPGAIMGSGGMIVADETHLHGGHRPLLPDLHPGRVVRQVHSLPGGHAQDAQHADRHHPGAGHAERPGPADAACATRSHKTSLCGLGQTAPNPVLTTMRYFGDEYTAHVEEHRCVAGSCTL